MGGLIAAAAVAGIVLLARYDIKQEQKKALQKFNQELFRMLDRRGSSRG